MDEAKTQRLARWWPSPSCGMKRTLVGAVAAATIAGVAVATPKPSTRALETTSIEVSASRITGFDRADRSRRTFGKLQWRGGLELSSPVAEFGGWSGLALDADGKGFLAVSDAGAWMAGELIYDKTAPASLDKVHLGPVLGAGGKPLGGGRHRDAEAVVLTSGSIADGSFLIAFEQKGRISTFRSRKGRLSAPGSSLRMPPELQRSRSDGFEAVTVLKAGALRGATIAVAERLLTKDRNHAGWIWSGREPKAFSLSDIGGFDITDLAGLPDGGILVLERRFRWSEGVKMRLRLVPAAEIKPGAVARGDVLLEADMGQDIDNMEGLAVHTGAAGETVITLISDDNFNRFLQRTVLLQFALPGEDQQAQR